MLLIASLIFYAWGEPILVFLMISSIIFNFFYGNFLNKYKSTHKYTLPVGILINLLPLMLFKYGDFFVVNLNTLISSVGMTYAFPETGFLLPVGISFYTFQTISYLVEIVRGTIRSSNNFINFALYVTFFPQLVAGPIVRYAQISKELVSRELTLTSFYAGLERFIGGLFKKVVIANTLSVIADTIFGLNTDILYPSLSWVGILAYTFQIYYDFSGYSDMAIGLGKMLGFDFPENFNFPYISRSIKEFWSRWHITLSSWFRDYVYIPLGGSRKGITRQLVNIGIVFLLTGLWHGASWNFVIWGGYYGVFLMIEKLLSKNDLSNRLPYLSWFVTMFIVIIGWVLFRADTIAHATQFLNSMFFIGESQRIYTVREIVNKYELTIFAIAIFFSVSPIQIIKGIYEQSPRFQTILNFSQKIKPLVIIALFLLAVMRVAGSTHNPFIYYRF